MTLLEKLSDLRKLSINDPEVADLFREHIRSGDYLIDDKQLKYVRIQPHSSGMIVYNADYECEICVYQDNLIKIRNYGHIRNECIDDDEIAQITVEDIFYPNIIPLFDKLFDGNNYINGIITIDTLIKYSYVTKSCCFENDVIKINAVTDKYRGYVSHGYILSKHFIALIRKEFHDCDTHIYVYVNNGDIPELTDEGFKKFISEHEFVDEQLTFRQFIGVNNIKSARNF